MKLRNTLGQKVKMVKNKKSGVTYRCTSPGKKNNGLLKKCGFEFRFDGEKTYNCPQCGEPLITEKKDLDSSESNRATK